MASVKINAELREDRARRLLAVPEIVVRVFSFRTGLRVIKERALKRCDLVLAVERRIRAAPEIPEKVGIFCPSVVHRRTAQPVAGVHEGLSAVRRIAYRHARKAAVRLHGDAAVIKKVAVAHAVHRALFQQIADMGLQLLAAQERQNKLIDELLLPLGETVRIGGIDRGKRNIVDAVFFPVKCDRIVCADEFVEKEAPVHFIFRMTEDELAFQLELDDRDGLEELGGNVAVFRHAVGHMRWEEVCTGVVAVLLHGEERERADIQAVTVLEHIKVAVFERVSQRVGNARRVSHRRTHPENVVVAPDKVHAMHVHKIVHDHLRGGASVEYVADDVQLVYRQAGDEIRQSNNEPVGNAGLDDAVDDAFKVFAFVGIVLVRIDELFNNVCIFLRQTGAHLDAGILVRSLSADGHKAVDRHTVPGIGVRRSGQLPLGIIEQPGKRVFLLLAEKVAEAVVDFVVDRARRIFEDMGKVCILTVNVAHKMLGCFRQLQNGLQPHDLRRRGRDARKALGEQFQILDLAPVHAFAPRLLSSIYCAALSAAMLPSPTALAIW